MPDVGQVALATIFPWSTLLWSFAIAVGAVLLLLPMARRTGWMDRPDSRKAHEGEIPLVGGWAVMLAMFLVQFNSPAPSRATVGYWIGALALFGASLIDDRFPVRARYRLLVQLFAAICCVSFGGRVLPDVGNLLGTGDLSAGWIVLPVSIFGTVAVVNAVNFTDGADGLCGGLGIIGLFWFAVGLSISMTAAAANGIPAAAYAAGMLPLAAAAIGALAGFLVFNLRLPGRARALVFLGDSGSTLVGFTLAWFAIHMTSAFGAASLSPVACLWIMAVPLADSASCFVRRLLAGVLPTRPDLKHFHHLLCRAGLTIGEAVFVIHSLSFVCGLVGVAGWTAQLPESWMFAAFVLMLAGFVAITNIAWRRLDRERADYVMAA